MANYQPGIATFTQLAKISYICKNIRILSAVTIFDDYQQHTDCRISKHLLWEYDIDRDFDWWSTRKVVVARVIERGWLNDWYAMLNLYGGMVGVAEIIKEIPVLSPRDINFVSLIFNLQPTELKCYNHTSLRRKLFDS